MSTVVQSAGALEPIIREAFKKRPSKIGALGLRTSHLLAQLAADDRRSSSRLQKIAERGTVGIVFVDVAGFTNFTERVGDAEASRVLAVLNDMVLSCIKTAKGECVKGLGDGYLLAFPSASQAITGSMNLARTAGKARADGRFPLHLRIAVHAGEPLVAQDDLLGHDVNLTARLLDLCKPGQVLVSEAAKLRGEGRLKKVAFIDRRSTKLRGLTSSVTVYNAVRSSEPDQPPKN